MMTTVFVWLAVQLRHLAQWLDPLPDTVSALYALLEQSRATVLDLGHELERVKDQAQADVDEARAAWHGTQEAMATLQREHAHCLPVAHDDLFAKTQEVVAKWSQHDTSGEHKRHQALAELVNAFPGRSKREMALAIEAALWQ